MTLPMPKIVVSDTSCLIVLSKIGKLDILRKLYSKIIITPEIANEFGDELPTWISEISVTDVQKQKILEIEVDRGCPVYRNQCRPYNCR